MDAQSLKCRVVEVARNEESARPNSMYVTVEFDDGDPLGPWTQTFAVVAKTVLSIDELAIYLSESDVVIHRPVDPFIHIREAAKNGTEFLIPKPPAPLS